jgi:hypothetical protein
VPISPSTAIQEQLLGSDVALDDNGNWMVAYRNGFTDIACLSGLANLGQALLSRINSTPQQPGSRKAGSLPAHPLYGVGAVQLVSEPTPYVLQQLNARFLLNLNQEYRIKPIQSSAITFQVSGNSVICTIVYTPINSEVPQNLIFPIYIQS